VEDTKNGLYVSVQEFRKGSIGDGEDAVTLRLHPTSSPVTPWIGSYTTYKKYQELAYDLIKPGEYVENWLLLDELERSQQVKKEMLDIYKAIPPLKPVEVEKVDLGKIAMKHARGAVKTAGWFHESMQTGMPRPGSDRINHKYSIVRYDTYDGEIWRWANSQFNLPFPCWKDAEKYNYENIEPVQRALFIYRCQLELAEILADNSIAMLLYKNSDMGIQFGSHNAFVT
jgi:hypothetical protein